MTTDGKHLLRLEPENASLEMTQEEFDANFADLLANRQNALVANNTEIVSDIDKLLARIGYYPDISIAPFYEEDHRLYTAIRVYYNGHWYILCVLTDAMAMVQGVTVINTLAATMQHLKGGKLQITLAMDPLQLPESQRLLKGIVKVPNL